MAEEDEKQGKGKAFLRIDVAEILKFSSTPHGIIALLIVLLGAGTFFFLFEQPPVIKLLAGFLCLCSLLVLGTIAVRAILPLIAAPTESSGKSSAEQPSGASGRTNMSTKRVVKVRKREECRPYRRNGALDFTEKHAAYCGAIASVVREGSNPDFIYLDIDCGELAWAPSWVEDLLGKET